MAVEQDLQVDRLPEPFAGILAGLPGQGLDELLFRIRGLEGHRFGPGLGRPVSDDEVVHLVDLEDDLFAHEAAPNVLYFTYPFCYTVLTWVSSLVPIFKNVKEKWVLNHFFYKTCRLPILLRKAIYLPVPNRKRQKRTDSEPERKL